MAIFKRRYRVHELADYVSWVYFFHAWQFAPRFANVVRIHDCSACRMAWINSFGDAERRKAREASRLYDDAMKLLREMDERFCVNALFGLFDANADGDDIVVYRDVETDKGCSCHREDRVATVQENGASTEYGEALDAGDSGAQAVSSPLTLPLLRQQVPDRDGLCLCLSDFVRPLSLGGRDKIGLFAAAVDAGMERIDDGDDYISLLSQTLADRLAEAAAERLHEEVRKSLWGYDKDECLSVEDMLLEKFQGIRPAVGYPCLPDISLNFLIDEALDLSRIGIELTEHGMMRPHASVSGLMISHPQARYFSVGRIDEAQLADYSRRMGKPLEEVRSYLCRNLET